jgi:hypothetical protein
MGKDKADILHKKHAAKYRSKWKANLENKLNKY